MSDDKPDGDDNIRVRCVACRQEYMTSAKTFVNRTCACPICEGNKAQAVAMDP